MSTPFKMKGFSGFGEGTGSPLTLFGGIKNLVSRAFGGGGDDAPAMQEGGDNLGTVAPHGPEAHTGGGGGRPGFLLGGEGMESSGGGWKQAMGGPNRAEEMMSLSNSLGGGMKWGQGGGMRS